MEILKDGWYRFQALPPAHIYFDGSKLPLHKLMPQKWYQYMISEMAT